MKKASITFGFTKLELAALSEQIYTGRERKEPTTKQLEEFMRVSVREAINSRCARAGSAADKILEQWNKK